MATATPVPPLVSAGAQTSEFKLARLAGFLGLAMIVAGAVVSALLPAQKDLGADLIKWGSLLMGTTGVAYTAFRSGLKIFAAAKLYEPEAEAVAKFIPGPVGAEARTLLPVIEKLVNALADAGNATSSSPAPAPAAIAVTVAKETPVAAAGSAAAPSAA